MSDHPEMRVGNAEREEAARALEEHFRAGRLDADAYEDRRGKALDAVTRADLVSLFADLPTKDGAGRPLPRPAAASQAGIATTDRIWRAAIALSPFVAVLLFFLTDIWLWFLLIPALAIIHGVFYSDRD